MRGKFIVFEGVEGCGKTTQLCRTQAWLAESGWLNRLQGHISEVLVTREPGGTHLGTDLRQLLLGEHPEPIADRTELLLYAADRAQHVAGYLRPQLANGALILCDRYTDSTVAYQGYGRGLERALIDQLNQIATDGLVSDVTLWLDLDAATGLERTRKRGVADRIEQADLAFHERVQQGFQSLYTANPQRIVRIAADQPEAAVAAQVQAVLSRCFAQWYDLSLSDPVVG